MKYEYGYGYGYEIYEMYKFHKKDPPEKILQNELKIDSTALLTSWFRHFLFLALFAELEKSE